MEKARKLEDIQCGVQQIQTKLSKLEEERNQFSYVATEIIDLYQTNFIPYRELEYYPLSVKDEMDRLEDIEMLKRNEQLLDDFITERKEELKKAVTMLEDEKEELLFQQRRLESQKEGKNGD